MNSVLPPWLQILVAFAALFGPMLAAISIGITVWLRRRDTRPRLSVEAQRPPTRDNKLRLMFVVRNKGRVPAVVDELYIEARHPAGGRRKMQLPEMYAPKEIPVRLEPGENVRLEAALPFLFARLDRMGFEGQFKITTTVVDGLGKRYKAKPFRIDLTEKPEGDLKPL